jgi:hypothetical protein
VVILEVVQRLEVDSRQFNVVARIFLYLEPDSVEARPDRRPESVERLGQRAAVLVALVNQAANLLVEDFLDWLDADEISPLDALHSCAVKEFDEESNVAAAKLAIVKGNFLRIVQAAHVIPHGKQRLGEVRAGQEFSQRRMLGDKAVAKLEIVLHQFNVAGRVGMNAGEQAAKTVTNAELCRPKRH